ncbi:MAG TPA: CHAT domain-containing protein [Thermoanaerobaculia bacterium]|jgi:Flp pilus assembly protein TadD|nr:CHAT domain-containing protein [Thermoanaerobaculia bacterium]
MRYESFSLRIEPSPGGSFAVSVQSPQGEGQGTFRVPTTGGLSAAAAGLSQDEEGGSRDLCPRGASRQASALAVGKELFSELFQGEVANLFHSCLGSLGDPRQGLRIGLVIDPRRPESARLQQLAWELLCRPQTEDFLCLSRRTPVVRSLAAHRERRPPLARPRRLRILAIAASPRDWPPLAVARERTNLEEAWGGQENQIEIVFLQGGGLEAMRQALLEKNFHILHFMGHGQFAAASGEGALLFERGDGGGELFDGRRLAQLLHDFRSLRLVVLNACHTAAAVGSAGPNPFAGVASSLVMGGVPAVVAMSGPVADRAAVSFSRVLYRRLAAGDVIEQAVTEGRLAMQRVDASGGAWAVPVLFLRGTDGMLFAPRSAVWARRAAILAGLAMAVALVWVMAVGWLRERRGAQAMRHGQDGIGLLQLGRKEEARAAFLAALDAEPGYAPALGNLVAVEMELGDDDAALGHAQAAVQAAPAEAVYRYNLGNLLARKQRYEEALLSLRRAIELDPNYAYAYNELGGVYLALARPAEARKALEAGLRHDQTLGCLHKNLGRAALREGHVEEAILHLETALPLYPAADPAGKAEAAYWLAAAEAQAGRGSESCAALRGFAALDPRRLTPYASDAARLAKRQRCAPWP